MRKAGVILLSCALLISAGCATAPTGPGYEPQREFLVNAPPSHTWDAVVAVMSDFGADITSLDGDSRYLITDWMGGVLESYCDCGSAPLAIERDRQGRFSVYVRETDDGGAKITINAKFRVLREFDFQIYEASCLTMGQFEADVARAVKDHLGVAN
jgi:hypothetical protein